MRMMMKVERKNNEGNSFSEKCFIYCIMAIIHSDSVEKFFFHSENPIMRIFISIFKDYGIDNVVRGMFNIYGIILFLKNHKFLLQN